MNFKPARIVYCDLDGVLADFDHYIENNLSAAARDSDDQMWLEIQSVPNFYQKLRAMEGAALLWQAIKAVAPNRKVLTALPRKSSMPLAGEDKRVWCHEIMRESIFGGEYAEVIFGPYSRDKQKHAAPGDILIDDRKSNIDEWNDVGGIGIYHVGDVEATIRELNYHTGNLS